MNALQHVRLHHEKSVLICISLCVSLLHHLFLSVSLLFFLPDQPVRPRSEEEDVSVCRVPAQGRGGVSLGRGLQAAGPEEGRERREGGSRARAPQDER